MATCQASYLSIKIVSLAVVFWSCVGQAIPDDMEGYQMEYPPSVIERMAPPGEDFSLADKAMSVERGTCGGVCYDYPRVVDVLPWPSCQKCHCDTMCTVFHDCCPDVLLEHDVIYTEPRPASCQTLAPVRVSKLDAFGDSDKDPTTYSQMVTTCREGDTDLQDKCQNIDLQNISLALPVASPVTGLVYRNLFCAQCNGLDRDSLESWTYKVECAGTAETLLHLATTPAEIFSVLSSTEGVQETRCHIQYASVGGANVRERSCRPESPDGLIDTCNVTGDVEYFAPETAAACALYFSPFRGRYRNMFCFLCNQIFPQDAESFRMSIQTGLGSISGRLDFAALIDLSGTDQGGNTWVDISTDCPTGQFFDRISCSCRDQACILGKYLTSDGQCKSLLTSSLLGYETCFRMKLDYPRELEYDDLNHMSFMIPLNLANIYSQGSEVHLNVAGVMVETWCPGDHSATLLIQADFIVHDNLETFESEHIHRIKDTISNIAQTVRIDVHPNTSLELTSSCVLRDYPPSSFPCPGNFSWEFDLQTHRGPFTPDADYTNRVYYLPYLEINSCPFVVLNPTESDEVHAAIEAVPVSNVSLSKQFLLDKVNVSQVRMCVSAYASLWPAESYKCQELVFMDMWTPKGLVSIVCTCLSLLCLALTLLTYTVLAPLRAGGGKTVMCMAAALFTAQALYEFALEQAENSAVCRALGVLTHYAWLVTIFFMNACTLERFLKLCFPLRSHSLFLSKTPLIAFTTYSMLGPALIVAVNIGVHYATGGGFAYGNSYVCFINTSLGRVLAWAVPLGLLVLTNTALMVITVCKLRRQARPGVDSSAHHHSVSLVACARLSIVTGVTWALAFLYELFENDFLSYVITALIACQGVFLFVSLVLNARVKDLYMKKWDKGGKSKHAGSSPANTKSTSTGVNSGNTKSTGLPVSSGYEPNQLDDPCRTASGYSSETRRRHSSISVASDTVQQHDRGNSCGDNNPV